MTYPRTKVFMVKEREDGQLSLRRYSSPGTDGDSPRVWTCATGWHDASNPIGEVEYVHVEDSAGRPCRAVKEYDRVPLTDSRWPTHCEKGCGYAFTEDDQWQHFTAVWFQRVDGEDRWIHNDLPPGAMYDAWWLPWKGPDGLCLTVLCPNGAAWNIDGRASNCTLPEDKEHRCWVRHGVPPEITVDKNGLTCAAGAGSIQADDYHGFLQDGWLTDG